MSYKKLVRDKIIDIIKANGENPKYYTLTENEYLQELNKKLFEEANEFFEAYSEEELADLLEVIYSIAKLKKINLKKVEQIRQEKKEARGGFEKRIYLEEVKK